VNKTFRYRLYPTRRQRETLEHQLREACRLYNAALEERREAYKKTGKSPSLYDQTKSYTQVRRDGNTDLVHYKIGQDVLQRVDRAFQAFFQRHKLGQKAGYPRFKGWRRYDSITYINYPPKPHVDREGKLILQGIGHIKVRWHRPVEGTTKTCTIRREAGRWYVCFSVECEASPLPESHEAVGLDVGLECFAMLSTGERLENPRVLKAAERQLRRAQRRLSRRKRGSHRRRKAVAMLQRAHVHVRQQRRHLHHVSARTLVNRFQVIGVEDLNIRHMTASARGTAERPGRRVQQKAGLNRAILDAAWGQFLLILTSKAAEAGRQVITVDARGTSQHCPCGAPNPKRLDQRWHHCAACGLDVPRDQASAMEIQRLVLLQLSA
jgi:putative transposase